MTKAQNNLLQVIEAAGVISWTDILSTPNGAKEFSTRKSRNTTVALELQAKGLIKRANTVQVGNYIAAFERQTQRMVRHLKSATERGHWIIVREIAESLEYRSDFTDALFVINRQTPPEGEQSVANHVQLPTGAKNFTCTVG